MKYFIALSYSHREEFAGVIDRLKQVIVENGDEYVVFVEKTPNVRDERELISFALTELSGCDGLIAETSYHGEGVGIEIGVAHAQGKPIISIRRRSFAPSAHMEGLSDVRIEYEKEDDLTAQLPKVLKDMHGREKEDESRLTPFAQFLLDASSREAETFLSRENIIRDDDPEYRNLITQYVIRESIIGFIFTQQDKINSGIPKIVREGSAMLRGASIAQAHILKKVSLIEMSHPEWSSCRIEDNGRIISKIWNEMNEDEREVFFSPLSELPISLPRVESR